MRWTSLIAAVGAASACASGALAAQIAITITDTDGKPVAESVVALTSVEGGGVLPVKPLEASLDQVNKTFKPHVLAVEVGTLVTFPNSDQIRHQVYSFSEAKKFETKLYSGKTAAPVVFDKPGVVVLGCNIHDSMRAYVYVVDTPYFVITDEAGRASMSAPAGRYSLDIWHPRHANGRAPLHGDYQLGAAGQTLERSMELSGHEE